MYWRHSDESKFMPSRSLHVGDKYIHEQIMCPGALNAMKEMNQGKGGRNGKGECYFI